MNKLERRLKTEAKFKRRLKLWYPCSKTRNRQHYALKTTSTPCSCHLCSNKNQPDKAKYRLNTFDFNKINLEDYALNL